jgi:hypothetical protein
VPNSSELMNRAYRLKIYRQRHRNTSSCLERCLLRDSRYNFLPLSTHPLPPVPSPTILMYPESQIKFNVPYSDNYLQTFLLVPINLCYASACKGKKCGGPQRTAFLRLQLLPHCEYISYPVPSTSRVHCACGTSYVLD